VREHDFPRTGRAKGRNRFDDDDLTFEKRFTEEPEWDETPDKPEFGDRWSTWDLSTPTERGPLPHPDWVITELAAVDSERGVLKTGKEADVFLVHRFVPGTDRSTLLAAKRYRSHDHRMFHRDSGYLEGRRDKESRVNRAMAARSEFGKEAIAARWAGAEFGALAHLWQVAQQLGVAPFTPYPVQILGTEILQEFIGSPDGTAAPRLAQVRTDAAGLADLWQQLVLGLTVLARAGYAHGDLSPYNILVHEGRLVIIDLPQIVDVVANPQGVRFLTRDVHNVAGWFTSQGLAGIDEAALTAELLAEAGMR
jgi:RIO kinase 1